MDDLAEVIEKQEAEALDRLQRIEDGLRHDGVPLDPHKRVEAFVAASPPDDRGSAALLQVVVHANTARRCRTSMLDGLADTTTPGSGIRALGEAEMAALSFYLAAWATRLACIELDNPGPIGRRRLDELISNAEHMRDCVMHWDDKARAKTPAFLSITERDILVVGSARGRSTIAGLSWKRFDEYARRLGSWAEFHLAARIASAADPARCE